VKILVTTPTSLNTMQPQTTPTPEKMASREDAAVSKDTNK
jgi:hypothetical protein